MFARAKKTNESSCECLPFSAEKFRKLINSQKIPLLFELDILNIVDKELGSCVNIYYIGLTVYFDFF